MALVKARPRARSGAPVALALVLAAGAAGCGSKPTRGARDGVLRVALDEYRLVPQRVSARAGPVTFSTSNRGVLAHNLRLVKQERRWGGVGTHKPGRAGRVTLRLEPGNYRMLCSVGQHEELGMFGSLAVR